MEEVTITNTEHGKDALAEVMQRSDKILRVAIKGTTVIIHMTRSDTRRPYVGNLNGMEFTSYG